MKTYNICGMVIKVNKGVASIEKSLREDSKSNYFGGLIDGVESLVLAMACAGINLNDKKIQAAVQSAVDAITNQE